RIHAIYARIGHALEIGQIPAPPQPRSSLVVVPVATMSRLVREGISAALSLGDEVIAVTVCYDNAEDQAATARLREQWEQWDPGVPLLTLHTTKPSLGMPIVEYLRQLEIQASHDQLVVLIPEVRPERPWRRILHNQRGFVLEQAIQRGTEDVVICRLRYRLSTVAADGRGGNGQGPAGGPAPTGPELPPVQPLPDQRR